MDYLSLSGLDIDECSEGIHQCAQNCLNTPESYICSCDDGYTLNIDGHNCTDIDECALNTDGCAHHCQNTVDSYNCSCNSGYRLSADQHTCNGMYAYSVCCIHIMLLMLQTLMSVWKVLIDVSRTAKMWRAFTYAHATLDSD